MQTLYKEIPDKKLVFRLVTNIIKYKVIFNKFSDAIGFIEFINH